MEGVTLSKRMRIVDVWDGCKYRFEFEFELVDDIYYYAKPYKSFLI